MQNGERAIRDWIRHLEQDWNSGDVESCIGRLHAEVIFVDRERQRRARRESLGRWLKLVARSLESSQSRWVIEAIRWEAAGSIGVDARVQCRYLCAEQVREHSLSVQLALAAQAENRWEIVGIQWQRQAPAYD